jgi:short-subunit dehydrogenase
LIINFSSLAALGPVPNTATYASTKVYDNFLTESLYEEFKGKNIDVLSVLPGVVDTQLS